MHQPAAAWKDKVQAVPSWTPSQLASFASGDSGVKLVGTKRFIKVHLDTAQYHSDIMNDVQCYSGVLRPCMGPVSGRRTGYCHASPSPFAQGGGRHFPQKAMAPKAPKKKFSPVTM